MLGRAWPCFVFGVVDVGELWWTLVDFAPSMFLLILMAVAHAGDLAFWPIGEAVQPVMIRVGPMSQIQINCADPLEAYGPITCALLGSNAGESCINVAPCCMVLGWLGNITAQQTSLVRRQCGTMCDGYQLLQSIISLRQDASCQLKSVSTTAKESIGLRGHCDDNNHNQDKPCMGSATPIIWVHDHQIDNLRICECIHAVRLNHASNSHFQMLK